MCVEQKLPHKYQGISNLKRTHKILSLERTPKMAGHNDAYMTDVYTTNRCTNGISSLDWKRYLDKQKCTYKTFVQYNTHLIRYGGYRKRVEWIMKNSRVTVPGILVGSGSQLKRLMAFPYSVFQKCSRCNLS